MKLTFKVTCKQHGDTCRSYVQSDIGREFDSILDAEVYAESKNYAQKCWALIDQEGNRWVSDGTTWSIDKEGDKK